MAEAAKRRAAFLLRQQLKHDITLNPDVIPMLKEIKPGQLGAPLHVVTKLSSSIRKTPKVRKNFQALGLHHRHQTVIHKNTPSINGMLETVSKYVKVVPLVVREVSAEEFNKLRPGVENYFLSSGGQLIVKGGEL
eukprot:CFRG5581T1